MRKDEITEVALLALLGFTISVSVTGLIIFVAWVAQHVGLIQ